MKPTLLSLLLVCTHLFVWSQASDPNQEQYQIDQRGIPHIYTNNEADLFFAQGFNAARDRLFQFEIW